MNRIKLEPIVYQSEVRVREITYAEIYYGVRI